ncbi:MAG: F0F1 ATP synthase subunit A [Phycisphaerales bacterium JB065]
MPASDLMYSTLAADGPLSHTLDKLVLGEGAWALSMNTITLLIAFGLYLWFMTTAAKAIAVGPESDGNDRYLTKGRFSQIVEVMVLGLRDQFIKPQLGEQTNKYLPFLLTLFFFILVNNLLGLVPLLDIQHLFGHFFLDDSHWAVVGGTPTGRLATNAALALVAFLIWNFGGIKSNGIGGWLHHFMGGAPWYMAPIMIPVEIIGAIVKPTALTIRLFANMTAGHVLLAAIIGFVSMSIAGLGVLFASPIVVISIVGAILIFFLEVFVAFLQAFVFMFLTAVFIAQMVHHDHEHDDEHGHDNDSHLGSAIPEESALGAA